MPSAFGSLTVVDYGSNVPTVLENNDEAYPSAWMRCNEYQFTAWFCLLILPFCDILSNFPNLKIRRDTGTFALLGPVANRFSRYGYGSAIYAPEPVPATGL